MNVDDIKKILSDVKENTISVDDALETLKHLPFKDLNEVKLDFHRGMRDSLGEVIYAKGKTHAQLELICKELLKGKKEKVMFTRVGKKKAQLLLSIDKDLIYNKPAKLVYKTNHKLITENLVLVITGGTSDVPVAEEAACTAEVMGARVERHFDVGVAGIHRLFSIYERLHEASVIVAIAGMEGALPSVVSGLVGIPVIAVPTSIGYGANFKGMAPLLSMLNSCSPGVAVVNIDNGFGAGYLACQIAAGSRKKEH